MGVVAEKAVTAVNQKAAAASGATLIQLQGDDGVMGQRSASIKIYPADGVNEVTIRSFRDDGETVDGETVITDSKELRVPDTGLYEFECTVFNTAFLLTVRQ